MEKKTTVILDPRGIIKDITLSVGILEGLQNLLVHYLSQCKDHNEITETSSNNRQNSRDTQKNNPIINISYIWKDFLFYILKYFIIHKLFPPSNL